tara:strand:- start:780 stop:1901 length:1122 start_codon:yes stop_codon:yes gene_type:complete
VAIKKKIVLLGTAYPFRGGLASYNERLAKEFQKEGYEFIIYTFTVQYPNFLFPGKTQYSSSPKPNNLVIERKINSVNPFNWLKIGLELRRMRPAVIISKFWIPFIGPSLGTINRIAKSKDTKIISILDNVIPHEKRIGDKSLAKYYVGSVDGFVAMSDSVKDDLAKFTNKTCLLNPHPLFDNFGEKMEKNKALDKLKLSKENKYILFFGFIRDYKGLDLLLEAMQDKELENKNVKLIIAGEYYSNEQKYLDLIEKVDLKNKVRLFTEFIPNEEVATYFSAADLVVQPYKTATQSGITQIAYHFEKPMIVTDVGGLKEIVPEGKVGFVVQPEQTEIADAINKFYESTIDFDTHIKEEKKKYSWLKLVNTLEELF